jgi:hypothetical protein
VDPTEWIAAVEQDLRSLIETVLGTTFGFDWIQSSGLTQPRLEQLSQRRDEEMKRRQGGTVDSNLLRYSNFFELKIIIDKHWEKFKEVLGDKKSFDVYFDRIEGFRNAPAHSRELLPFERNLLAGLAGELRNRITISRSTMGPNKEFYPRIESARDSFGQEYVPSAWGDIGIQAPISLMVGQEVEFLCRSWDPNGRELTWSLEHQTVGRPRFDEGQGDQVSLKMIITEQLVGDGLNVAIMLRGTSRFHRNVGEYDDSVAFHYRVLPPED